MFVQGAPGTVSVRGLDWQREYMRLIAGNEVWDVLGCSARNEIRVWRPGVGIPRWFKLQWAR
jgi:hypothetical protein